MAIEDSIVLITSPQSTNRAFGTGFVIHSDAEADYVMTCRHVARDIDIQANQPVCINYHEYPVLDVFMNPADDPDDMAVVKVRGPLNMPPLPLGLADTPGVDIRIYGYYRFSNNPDNHRQVPVEGKLGERGILNFRSCVGRLSTWDLEIEGWRTLQEGYSGSPVVHSGVVVGLVSHKHRKGQVGIAVSIDALVHVCPDLASRLIGEASDEICELIVEGVKSKKVFISYAREDEADARRLYEDLKKAGVVPWMDKMDIIPGQNWKLMINEAIRGSDYFIALLSSSSVSKKGYVQKELNYALSVLEAMPPNEIYIVPVRLDKCEVLHEKMRDIHWVDLFSDYGDGLKRILIALGKTRCSEASEEEQIEIEKPIIQEDIIEVPEIVAPDEEKTDGDRKVETPGPPALENGLKQKDEERKGHGNIGSSRIYRVIGVVAAAIILIVTIFLLMPEKYKVTVQSNVEGDSVFIDGKQYGNTPLGIELRAGLHHFRVEKPEYVPFEKDGDVQKHMVIQAKLMPHQLTNDFDMTFKYIEPGSFMMGSPEDEPGRDSDESPRHEVTFSEGFYMQTTEVTQEQWKAVMGENPSRFKNCGDDCPVESVSWEDARAFIQKLNEIEGQDIYRLPSEAEWEYACRAGTDTPFFFGDCLSTDQANYHGNYPYEGCPNGEYREKPTPVGSFPQNEFGLYDMHGNVWEWCEDDYQDSYENAPKSGEPWIDEANRGGARVLRGGSWNNFARDCRSANRGRYSPDNRNDDLGFRLTRSYP